MLDIRNFEPIGVYEFAGHPAMHLYYPPVIEMLNFCYEQKFTRIHVLTPGPLGLVGLLIARILKLPVDSTYQRTLPAFVRCITKDESMEHVYRRYSTWFYNQTENIYTTSVKTARKMVREGIQSEKIKFAATGNEGGNALLPRGLNLLKNRFHLPVDWQLYDGPSVAKAIN
jgi:hypothetical protein